MKANLFPAIKLTLASLVFFSGLFTCAVWGIAQLAPAQGKGETITHQGKVHYVNIGQKFSEDRYFWSRPSAVAYNAAGSGGSNKGPSNPDYLAEVQARLDTFLKHNPGIPKGDVPADLITASGSGLDPNISWMAAKVQAPRIAQTRQMPQEAVLALIEQHKEAAWLGCFGPEKVNVLALNIALDQSESR